MKSPIFALSLAAGLIVSAGAIHEAHSTHADACAYMQREALKAATALARPESTQQLGFTPMDQFNKVYIPSCQPENESADTFSALVAGVLAGLACYAFASIFARITRSNHKESL